MNEDMVKAFAASSDRGTREAAQRLLAGNHERHVHESPVKLRETYKILIKPIYGDDTSWSEHSVSWSED